MQCHHEDTAVVSGFSRTKQVRLKADTTRHCYPPQ